MGWDWLQVAGWTRGRWGAHYHPSRTDGEDATEFLFSGRDKEETDALPEQRCGLDFRRRSMERLTIEHTTRC